MSSTDEDQLQKVCACTIARDIHDFDLLIEDMDAIFHEDWGNLTFPEAHAFLDTQEARDLEFLAIALDDKDQRNVSLISSVIEKASALNIRMVLIAEALSPILLHQLLRAGANDFVPYPLPESALQDAVNKLQKSDAAPLVPAPTQTPSGKQGTIFAVHALAGGVGGTNFAVNLAWELCRMAEGAKKTVCILDFDFQSGAVSTYLDLARTEKVYELLSQTSNMDEDAFFAAMQKFQDKLHVLTAPSDMLPLDLLTPDEIERVITMARDQFDFVIIDMPRTVVHWTETVLNMADLYFAVLELDLRSAQNALRMIRAMKADGISLDKYRFILSRAPKFTDLSGKARAKRMAESLDISFAVNLPDGGTQVRDANDHGLPLAEYAVKNPLYKEINKFARALFDASETTAIAAE
ncbi:pilus assembly protein CpaE [Roseinatronobacter thiooxidans]|uniref:Pilus assembly protein CpaE n=1 Tax=Roseinatronobacter thiooxidans TaxID=121821 RepID=A0A2W7PPR7_9RHOB|nr:AAA family ATPase [Roseinatronobacter thiooxidans]PZX38088.1 pilus assembly protein CpaE [Roseinatronobacter thiooxidans]